MFAGFLSGEEQRYGQTWRQSGKYVSVPRERTLMLKFSVVQTAKNFTKISS